MPAIAVRGAAQGGCEHHVVKLEILGRHTQLGKGVAWHVRMRMQSDKAGV